MPGDPMADASTEKAATPERPPAGRSRRVLQALAAFTIAWAVVYAVRYGDFQAWLHPDRVRALVAGYGAWGPLIYTGVKMITMILLIPLAPVAIVAGVLYGFVWGSVITLITTVLGAAITFAIGRKLGRETIQARLSGRLQGIDQGLGENGLAYIALARLAPVLPFSVVSYLAAVTSISWRDYMLGTAIGIIPTSLVYSYVGAAAGEASLGKLLVALSLLGGLALIPVILRQRRRMYRR